MCIKKKKLKFMLRFCYLLALMLLYKMLHLCVAIFYIKCCLFPSFVFALLLLLALSLTLLFLLYVIAAVVSWRLLSCIDLWNLPDSLDIWHTA